MGKKIEGEKNKLKRDKAKEFITSIAGKNNLTQKDKDELLIILAQMAGLLE